jgi:hypothetical protein
MIKRGDKAKGFRFDNTSGVRWNKQMENFVGVEGLVTMVRPKINELVIEFTTNDTEPNMQHWRYPLDQYLALQREWRLKELGI